MRKYKRVIGIDRKTLDEMKKSTWNAIIKEKREQINVVVCHNQVRLQVSQGFHCRDS